MWPYILFSPETSSFWLLKSCGRRVSKIAFNVWVLLSLFHSPLILCIKNMIFIMKLQWATDIMPRYLSLHASRHTRPWRLLLLGQNLSDVLTDRAVLSHREIYCDVNVVLRMKWRKCTSQFFVAFTDGKQCVLSAKLVPVQKSREIGLRFWKLLYLNLYIKHKNVRWNDVCDEKRVLKWSPVQSCSQSNVLNPCANKLAPVFALCFALFCWRFLLNWEQAHEKKPSSSSF